MPVGFVLRIDMLTQWKKDESGNAIVEFALVMPILLFLLFAIFTVGYWMNAQQIVTQAAREGARQGSLTNNNSQIGGAIAANMEAIDPLVVTDPENARTATTITPESESDSGRARGNPLTVRVQYQLPILFFDINLPGVGAVSNAFKTVTAEVTTMMECEPASGETVCISA
jgi:Flp pilus assembly protein TadG